MTVELNQPDASVLRCLEQLGITSKTLAHTTDQLSHRHPSEHISTLLNFLSTVDHQLTLTVNHQPPIDLFPLINFFLPCLQNLPFLDRPIQPVFIGLYYVLLTVPVANYLPFWPVRFFMLGLLTAPNW